MHWFEGSIGEAVTLYKQRNSIFVVFIEGDNENSNEMAAVLDDAGVVKRLSNETQFLAIKLKSGSENYMHFAKLYQLVPVPSLFFIGHNGTPLEVVCAGVQGENLASRIDRILEVYYKDKQPTPMGPSTSSQNIKASTSLLLQSEGNAAAAENVKVDNNTNERTAEKRTDQKEAETSSGPPNKIQKTEEYEVVCDGDVCIRRPKDQAGSSSQSSDEPKTVVAPAATPAVASASDLMTEEEKMQRAKELIDARNREKADKEKELAKEKELERRRTGQGVAELKRWQQDQELKQIQEERRREKMENDQARQRILQQIAQDRAERKAREVQVTEERREETLPPATSGDASSAAAKARIQFKLPDGGSHSAQFDADGTVADVSRYIATHLQTTPSSLTIWTAFPRRELDAPDATLRELRLLPSAALLVMSRRTTGSVATPSRFAAVYLFLSQLFTSLIMEPSQQLMAWMRARFSGAPRLPPRNPNTPSAPRASADGQSRPTQVRRRGNIHRLTGDSSNDDDNNTWNGNSTQQM